MTNTTTEASRENPPSQAWADGYDAAVREMRDDAWALDTCRSFLTQIGALEFDPASEREYGRGFNAAIRRRLDVHGAM